MDTKLIERLAGVVGKANVLHTPEDLAVYSYDGTFAEGSPDVVVLPATTEEVSQVVMLAAEARVPIVPRGMGSGLAAGSIPMTRRNRALPDAHEPHPRDRHGECHGPRRSGRGHRRPAGRGREAGTLLPARPVQHPTFDHRRERRLQRRRTALPEVRRDRRLCARPDRGPGGWANPARPAASPSRMSPATT